MNAARRALVLGAIVVTFAAPARAAAPVGALELDPTTPAFERWAAADLVAVPPIRVRIRVSPAPCHLAIARVCVDSEWIAHEPVAPRLWLRPTANRADFYWGLGAIYEGYFLPHALHTHGSYSDIYAYCAMTPRAEIPARVATDAFHAKRATVLAVCDGAIDGRSARSKGGSSAKQLAG